MCQRNIPDSDIKYVELLAAQIDHIRDLRRRADFQSSVGIQIPYANIQTIIKSWINLDTPSLFDNDDLNAWQARQMIAQEIKKRGKKR